MVSAASVAAPDPAQGRAAYDEGRRLFLAGNYREALTQFKKGYVSTEDPAFLLNTAQCQRFLGELNDALTMYRLYLKTTPEGANSEAHAVAAKAIRELEVETAAQVPAATSATTPASPAATPAVTPPRSAAETTAAPATGHLGRTFTTSGPTWKPSEAAYPLLDAPPEGDFQRLPAPPANPPSNTSTMGSLRLAGVACGSAGLVSLGVGVYFWTRATSLSNSASNAKAYNQADYDHGQRAETMQWIFYTVGAVAVVTGAPLYVYGRWSSSEKKASLSLAPVVGPGASGLVAQGSF